MIVGSTGLLPVPQIFWSTGETTAPNQYRPSFSVPRDHDILLVYIGSSSCGFADNPELPKIIGRTKLVRQQHAADKGYSFSAIGESIDWDPARGQAHLAEVGRIDETMTGRRMWGLGTSIW